MSSTGSQKAVSLKSLATALTVAGTVALGAAGGAWAQSSTPSTPRGDAMAQNAQTDARKEQRKADEEKADAQRDANDDKAAAQRKADEKKADARKQQRKADDKARTIN